MPTVRCILQPNGVFDDWRSHCWVQPSFVGSFLPAHPGCWHVAGTPSERTGYFPRNDFYSEEDNAEQLQWCWAAVTLDLYLLNKVSLCIKQTVTWCVLQGSVETPIRWGGQLCYHFAVNSMAYPDAKFYLHKTSFDKVIRKEKRGTNFWPTLYVRWCCADCTGCTACWW